MYEAIRQRIGEIIGEASMCWSETPKGVFNSDKAKELVDEVMCHIEYPLDHPDDEVSTRWENGGKEEFEERRKHHLYYGHIPVGSPCAICDK